MKPARRPGYRTMLGLFLMLWRLNRNCKRSGAQGQYTIVLPVRWI